MTTRILFSRFLLLVSLLIASRSEGQVVATNIAYAKRDVSPLDYYPDDTSTYYQVRGRVTSPHFATNGSEFYIQDTSDNVGIRVDSPTLRPNITLYTELEVIGKISQTAGVRRIVPELAGDISVTDPNPLAVAAVSGTISAFLANPESYEGSLVVISNAYAPTNAAFLWGANASITVSDSTARITMRVDVDTDIDGQLPPTNAFTLYGIFSQYDTSATPTGGYQVLPRFYADILQSTDPQPPQIFVIGSNSFSVVVSNTLAVTLIAQDRNAEDNLVISLVSGPAGANVQLQTQRVWRLSWTPDAASENTTNFFTLAVTDGAFTNQIVLEAYVLSQLIGNVRINEIHWDPAPGKAGDASGDGITDATRDEFIEIVNANTSVVDISSWQLFIGNSLLFTFPPTLLTGQTAVVVFGGPTATGLFGHSIVYFPTSNWSGLSNTPGTNSVRLVTDGGAEVSAYNYGAFGTPDMSITRNPDFTGDFVLQTGVVPFVRWTPGTMANGRYFEGTGYTNSPPLLAMVNDYSVMVGQSVTVYFTSFDPEGNSVSLWVSNAPSSAVFTDNGDGTASLIYTGQISDVGVFAITVHASDAIDEPVSRSFQLTVLHPVYAGLSLNEICFNPSTTYDANEDGSASATADEFVEIVNNSTGLVDLAGFMIYDAVGLRHRFASATIPTGGAIVVFGGANIFHFWRSPAQFASSGGLGLNNSPPERVILYDPNTNEVARYELTASAPVGASLARAPDLADFWTNHYEATTNTLRGSPGRKINGTPYYTNVPPVWDRLTNVTVSLSNAVTLSAFARAYDGDAISLTASNVPSGATFTNTSSVGLTTGVFTWAVAEPAGVYTALLYAADKDGVAFTSIVITVEDSGPPSPTWSASVVINEFRNSTPDFVELLVISNALDMRGMLLKDYSSSGASDNGGAYVFATNDLWAAVRAGTLIVLRNDTSSPDTSATGGDYNLEVGLKDTNFFIQLTGTFDIAGDEIVQIKSAVAPRAGHTNAIHTMATATANATNYAAAPIPKLDATAGNSGPGESVIASNSTSQLSDFNGNDAVGDQTTGSIGTWNTEANRIFILSLRVGDDQDADGIPDDWETLYFGCATCAVANADTDADGFSNLEEYLADTIPVGSAGSNSFFVVENMTNFTTRYILFLSSTGRVYTLQATADPSDANSWSNIGNEVYGTGTSMGLSDTNVAPYQMYRVRVRAP